MTYGNFVYFSKFWIKRSDSLNDNLFFRKIRKGRKLAKYERIFRTQTENVHSEHKGAIIFTISYLLYMKLLKIRENRTMLINTALCSSIT